MNTSTETLQPGQQAPSASKPLWAAVGILGAAVGGVAAVKWSRRSAETVPPAVRDGDPYQAKLDEELRDLD